MTESSINTPVLIVGAGPVGLTTALALTARGIKCRLIDKAAEASDKSKALVVHSRTLEMLESMGIVEQFLANGHKVHATHFRHGKDTLLHISFDEMEGAYPFALMIPQSETERLLTEALSKQGLEIERGIELTNFEQVVTHVNSELTHSTGTTEKHACRWLLGCDGAHSTTRHKLGMTFEGAAYQESFATADVHVHWDKPEDELLGYIHEDGVVIFFPIGGHRYRIIADGPLHNTGDTLTLDEMQQTLVKRGVSDAILSDPIWLTWFTVSRRSAKNYRDDRAFLIGDAAHIHSPALGQGMNTGMQDAFNLSWKLALVEQNFASADLLDTYQEERHPIGQNLLKLTDFVTRGIILRNPVAQTLRNKLVPLLTSHDVIQHRAWKTLSMLGINYRNSSLVGEHRASLTQAVLDAPAWLDFAHGPSPGDRAPDSEISLTSAINSEKSKDSQSTTRLFEVMKGTQHHLLLFAGLSSSGIGKVAEDLTASLKKLNECYGDDLLKVYIVYPGEISHLDDDKKSIEDQNNFSKFEKSEQNARIKPLYDDSQMMHHRYGAAHSCAYLVRPDGYVGFRSQPIDIQAIEQHLQKILSKKLAANAVT